MTQQILDTTTGAGDSGQAGGNKIKANFAELYGLLSKDPVLGLSTLPVEQGAVVNGPYPAPGTSVVVETITGAGCLREVYVVVSKGSADVDTRIQILCDGETLPSVDVDVGTFFGTAYPEGRGTGSLAYGNRHRTSLPSQNVTINGAATGFGDQHAWAGTFKFPVPFSNGCIVRLFAPSGMSTTGGFGSFYTQVAFHRGAQSAISNYRLRSAGVTALNAAYYSNVAQIVFADVPGITGVIADMAFSCKGDVPTGTMLNYGFLERQQYIIKGVETLTLSGDGAATTASYASSGGEDWPRWGFYFGGRTQIVSADSVVTCANNNNLTANFSIDFLERHGGVPFTGGFKTGWSLKDRGAAWVSGQQANDWITGVTLSHSVLYYVDNSVPVAPSAPQNALGASAGATSATFTWTRPKSDGSTFLTGYTVTLSPGGATQTVAANVNTATFTGLTTGTAYTGSIVATNAVGNSTAATATATPVSATAPAAPTIGTATAGNASASVTFTANGTGGSPITGFTVTSSPGGLTGTGAASPITVSGLTNGTAYTFTVTATNAVGTSSASSASNSVTPSSAADTLDPSNKGTGVVLSSGNLAATYTGSNPAQAARSVNSIPAAGANATYQFSVTYTGSVNSSTNPLHVGVCNGTFNLSTAPTTDATNTASTYGDGRTFSPTYPGAGDAAATYSGTAHTIYCRITRVSNVLTVAWKVDSGSYTAEYAAPAGAVYVVVGVLGGITATINFGTFP
jgi:hypothetical protein